ncbi:MAG: DUF1343 domain-containing protein [Candidatus Aminicenantes bacterium]|nr:DUF1343 domain-containing protein [Candidatus Aminicenantes bacterium]
MSIKRGLLFLLVLGVAAAAWSCHRAKDTGLAEKPLVRVGAEVLLDRHLDLIRGKHLGLITNHSAVLADGRHLLDALLSLPDVTVQALFSPEHGLLGTAPDGAEVGHGQDARTNLQVYSLYGEVTKPTPEMLEGIDLLVYDIQDVGVRFYTFSSTLFLTLEAAAERGIPYLVLDRPNPITGGRVEGAILEAPQRSFVGLFPLPIAHGMTLGELAMLANGEGWLKNGVKADLRVIKAEGWSRDRWFDETGLRWVKPSPNIMTLETAVVYPGACLIEGTNVSEGRGTDKPFEMIGAPYIDGAALAEAMNGCGLSGVVFEPVEFTPRDILQVTTDPKYENETCQGIFIKVTDRDTFRPVAMGIHLLMTLRRLYPDGFRWRSPSRSTGAYYVDLLAGTPKLREMVDAGEAPQKIISELVAGIQEFMAVREKYLLY